MTFVLFHYLSFELFVKKLPTIPKRIKIPKLCQNVILPKLKIVGINQFHNTIKMIGVIDAKQKINTNITRQSKQPLSLISIFLVW